MKKLVILLFSVLAANVSPASAGTAISHTPPPRTTDRTPRRHHHTCDEYAKDNWNVFYGGRKVSGASASSFVDLGGGYG
ncbi:DKNYY domain-containing protein, partial [Alistipes sp. OttesenSCG-928-L06]|nr:DKNYY domain-containing protein [Alistipes sp. OttesenSCG-928-L06]